jgi:amino acid permease
VLNFGWVGAFHVGNGHAENGNRNVHATECKKTIFTILLCLFLTGLLVAIAIGAIVGLVVGCIFLLIVCAFKNRFALGLNICSAYLYHSDGDCNRNLSHLLPSQNYGTTCNVVGI